MKREAKRYRLLADTLSSGRGQLSMTYYIELVETQCTCCPLLEGVVCTLSPLWATSQRAVLPALCSGLVVAQLRVGGSLLTVFGRIRE